MELRHIELPGHSLKAEIANALTHGIGAALSVVALVLMVVSASVAGDPYRIVGASIFGAALVMLYSVSTLYHAVPALRWKRVLRLVDHSCIYVLIAGTYTPFTLVTLRGAWGWSLLGVIWGLAIAGILFKTVFIGRFKILSVGIYIGMGWLAVIAFGPIVRALPPAGLFWVVAGGVMYTSGVVFYVWRKFPHHHAVWHLFVLAGSACHFIAVYRYVLPMTG